jgi:hypothetical protein
MMGVMVACGLAPAALAADRRGGHDRGVTLALALALPLIVAAAGECYLVTNTRIVLVPSCDLSPAGVAEILSEIGPEPERERVRPPERPRNVGPGRTRGYPRNAPDGRRR